MTNSPLHTGWISGRNIPWLLTANPSFVDETDHVMVTTNDSTGEVATTSGLVEVLEDRDLPVANVGEGLVLDLPTMRDLIAEDFFFWGFNVVWICPASPSEPLPEGVVFTGEGPRGDALPQGLTEWMRATSCKIGLGDGVGLNYVTLSDAIAEEIERLAAECGGSLHA